MFAVFTRELGEAASPCAIDLSYCSVSKPACGLAKSLAWIGVWRLLRRAGWQPTAQWQSFDATLYKDRNLIERFFNKIKHFRRIATRYDKLARNYAGFLNLVAALKCCR
ncbi:MAG: transposase [Tsuneonella suprasediminis]